MMKRFGLPLFIFIWASGLSYVLAHMHGIHRIEFKNQPINIGRLITAEFSTTYAMVHVLTEECGCSQIIAEYLIKRGALSDTKEFVYFVGKSEDYSKKLKEKGFEVRYLKEEDEHFQGVPMLTLYSKGQGIVYAGGYSKKIITPITKVLDLELLKELKQTKIVSQQYPIQGCAISKNLMTKIDPLGLKYSK